MTLEFNIVNQRITSPCNNYYVVADSVNYLKIDFQFTQDWQGFTKLITFRNGLEVISIEIIDNHCIVPWEVIKVPSFMFSIVGMKDGVLITTDVMKVSIRASGDKDGCEPKPPTRQFYEGLAGGTEGQVLLKNSDDDFDYNWGDLKDISYDGERTFEDVIDDIEDELHDHIDDTTVHTSAEEKENWNNKERAYVKHNNDYIELGDEEPDTYTLCFTNDMDGD